MKKKTIDFFKRKDLLTISVIAFVLSRFIFYAMHALLFKDFSFAGFIKGLNHFDSNHYTRIATYGYLNEPYDLSGEAGWAFFPFYPLFIKTASLILGGLDFKITAFIFGGCFLIAAAVTGGRYLQLTGSGRAASYIYCIFLTMGVYSFYFSAFYTEAPFLYFLTACFYHLEKKQYLRMGIFGLLLSFTRNIGVFVVFVILIRWLMDHFAGKAPEGEKELTLAEYFLAALRDPRLVLGVFMIPLGMFSFMYYLYLKTGDAFAFVHVQTAWARENTFFLKNYINALKDLTGYDAFCAMWATAGFFLVFMMVYKYRRYHEAFMGLVVLILPMMSVMDSVPRYMLGGLVFVLTFSRLLEECRMGTRLAVMLFVVGYGLILLNGWYYGAGVLI